MSNVGWCCSAPPSKGEKSTLLPRGLFPEEEADGSFLTGGELPLFSPRAIGLLLHALVLGVIKFGLQATAYGLFTVYLNVTPNVGYSQQAAIVIPWVFKLPVAFANDCLPIAGYRRIPYMAIGWGITTFALLASALNALPPPYWCIAPDGSYLTISQTNSSRGTPQVATPCNPAARDSATFYVFMQGLATVGLLFSEVHLP